jgi:hypothetical protein
MASGDGTTAICACCGWVFWSCIEGAAEASARACDHDGGGPRVAVELRCKPVDRDEIAMVIDVLRPGPPDEVA